MMACAYPATGCSGKNHSWSWQRGFISVECGASRTNMIVCVYEWYEKQHMWEADLSRALLRPDEHLRRCEGQVNTVQLQHLLTRQLPCDQAQQEVAVKPEVRVKPDEQVAIAGEICKRISCESSRCSRGVTWPFPKPFQNMN